LHLLAHKWLRLTSGFLSNGIFLANRFLSWDFYRPEILCRVIMFGELAMSLSYVWASDHENPIVAIMLRDAPRSIAESVSRSCSYSLFLGSSPSGR
jgi:hypothetical protein